MWIWQDADWPHFKFDAQALQPRLASARVAQGQMLGVASGLRLLDLGELQVTEFALEAVATAQIEGELLQINSVRASAARRLGLTQSSRARLTQREPRAEATLDVIEAAVAQWPRPLAESTLFDWHAALFPNGRSGITRIVTGAYRTHPEPMQIVTPRLGKRDTVHYEAPASRDVPLQMQALIAWFNDDKVRAGLDGIVRAALAHLWFETVHPFEDGNGRIGRALSDLALAQDMRSSQRLFSLSQQIWLDRQGYYAELQRASRGPGMEVTPWVEWFVGRVEQACLATLDQMQTAAAKSAFWVELQTKHPQLTPAQRKVLNKLFDAEPQGFAGGMSTEKYTAIAGVSRATAYRELTQLADAGLLERSGQGRGTRYALVPRNPSRI
ncbi:Fic family protein [Variovorax soli]|uniref:Fic family protein n=1 Tax=Variovorax soli TaxID=376815 RepID=A0ABU1NFX2_9BURK|nr:Fic family protein [Variovorax soli]MDR6537253.1 Fic family protein [Variovorax soli]